MRLPVLKFFAGFSAAMGSLFLSFSLGTDYWLLASESCDPGDHTPIRLKRLTEGNAIASTPTETAPLSFHEGIFWRCTFKRKLDDTVWAFWITNQPPSKTCMPAYLFTHPVGEKTSGVTALDPATVYRGLWCIVSLLAILSILIGGLVTVCAFPLANQRLYKVGGALFITGGLLYLCVMVMFVVWVQLWDSLEQSVFRRRGSVCSSLHLDVHYGVSFMFAPISVFFCLLAGLLLLLLLLLFIQTPTGAGAGSTEETERSAFTECNEFSTV
ncbi:transmembrane protein 182 [Chanos chanos]|uniref:Transmembrane protein 182 n=1 Tax=Chanos chanos TaxID=29144 RepID=A0A6J2W0D8_CHACN|nr:transmembrane protein 182-like [Chanos chanos]